MDAMDVQDVVQDAPADAMDAMDAQAHVKQTVCKLVIIIVENNVPDVMQAVKTRVVQDALQHVELTVKEIVMDSALRQMQVMLVLEVLQLLQQIYKKFLSISKYSKAVHING